MTKNKVLAETLYAIFYRVNPQQLTNLDGLEKDVTDALKENGVDVLRTSANYNLHSVLLSHTQGHAVIYAYQEDQTLLVELFMPPGGTAEKVYHSLKPKIQHESGTLSKIGCHAERKYEPQPSPITTEPSQ